MESDRFDALTRLMAAAGTRRGAIASALGLGATYLPFAAAVEAGKKKKQRRRKRRRRERRRDGRAIPLGGACGSGQQGACSGNATCLDGVCSPPLETEACGDGPPCPPCQRCQNGQCTWWPNSTFACNGRRLRSTGEDQCTTQANVGVCVNGACECGQNGSYDAETNQCRCSAMGSDFCEPRCCIVNQVCVRASTQFVLGGIACVNCP